MELAVSKITETMTKKFKNTYKTCVCNGHTVVSDCMPESSTISRAFFFTLNINTLQKVGAKHLSFYLKLKPIFKNSCFYDYSINKIAKYAECSNEKAKRHIKALINLGLIEIRDNNLILKSIKRGKCNKNIFISSNFSIKDINDKLLLLLIQHKNKQMTYANNKANKDVNKGETSGKKMSVHETCTQVIGIRNLSDYLKISPFYLSNFTKRMIKAKKLKVKRVKKNLGKVAIFSDFISHYLYNDKLGNTIHYLGSTYSIL